MEGLYVKAHVGRKLKSFLECSYQNGVIVPPRNSNLINFIKPYLELHADEEMLPDDETVTIELPDCNDKVYCYSGRKTYVCTTLWRNRLSEYGHKRVRQLFENYFKFAFRIYMDAYVEQQKTNNTSGSKTKVREGVVQFLMQYHIDFDERMVSSMVRDWWRHNDKNEIYDFSPLIC
ncbi:MAG: hypothetical protein Q4F69_11165 [Bacteroidia bacterium]|nr:hypothetical protein [Bacteroidia bacterium]